MPAERPGVPLWLRGVYPTHGLLRPAANSHRDSRAATSTRAKGIPPSHHTMEATVYRSARLGTMLMVWLSLSYRIAASPRSS